MSDVVLRKYLITVQGDSHAIDTLEERLQEALEEAKEEEGLTKANLKQLSNVVVDDEDDEELDDESVELDDEENEEDE